MLKWLVTLIVVLFVLGVAGPLLAKFGLVRLPATCRWNIAAGNSMFP